jgi:outer membrane protein OmpA-like peptidoglycan-associated protein
LDEVVALLNKFKEAKFLLEGHADDTGSANYNDKLSVKRVDNVKSYLVSKGIDVARFTANSYGETKPATPNNTKEGRAKNRRVEISLIK